MSYRQKKSILAGTSGHRKAINLVEVRKNLRLNKSIDKSSNSDGRAKSSAFQKVTDADTKALAEQRAKNNKKKNTKSKTKVTKEKGTHEGMEGVWTHTDITTGGSGVGSAAYNKAFAEARAAGKPTFMFEGNSYTTELASSSTDRKSTFDPNLTPITPRPIEPLPINTELPEPKKSNIDAGCREGRSKESIARAKVRCSECKGRKNCRWDIARCFCRSDGKTTKRKISETAEKIGDATKDAFKCMRNGFMSKNGKPTKIPCSGVDGGIRTSMN